MRMRLVGIGVGLTLLCGSASAFAYCRATTCDVNKTRCDFDANGCNISGVPLYWASTCTSFSLQKDGSPRREISVEQARQVISTAFETWISVDCGAGTYPSIQIARYQDASCTKQQYNHKAANANIWMFLDGDWPYEGTNNTLALTTLTFNTQSGQIYDADVEINSFNQDLTVGDTNVRADLESIVTHEAGHFLGLAHTQEKTATMFASYNPGQTQLRSLSPDDVAGICAIYPPNRPSSGASCEPRSCFSPKCDAACPKGGCTTASVHPTATSKNSVFGWAGVIVVALALRLRSRARRASRA
jgi:predicted Zn-dependent protease